MTTTAKGALGQVLVVEEGTYKTTPASPAMFKIPVLSEDVTTNQNQLPNDELRANRSPAGPILGNKDIRGTLRATCHFDAWGHWFNFGLGAPTTTASGTVGGETYAGSGGLDDLTSGGTYSGTALVRVEVEIDSTGTTDTFQWRLVTIDSLGQETNGSWTTSVSCDTSAITLQDGITVVFGAITGHDGTTPDAWSFYCYGQTHHVFTVGSSLNTFQLERGLTDTADYFLLKGCMVESLSLTMTPEGIVALDVGVLGSSWTFGTSTVANSTTTYTSDVQSMFEVSGILEGGSSYTNVSELSWTWNNNPEGIYTVGGAGEFGILEPSNGSCSGTLTTLFQDQTLITKATGNTESSLVTAIASGNEWIRFEFNELKYQPMAPTLPNAQVLRNQLPWMAYYGNDSNASAFRVILFGGSASY